VKYGADWELSLPIYSSFSSLSSAFAPGGGLLGIGTVGYTYILEKAGLRFRYCRAKAHLTSIDLRFSFTTVHASQLLAMLQLLHWIEASSFYTSRMTGMQKI
jgi:hypothetical protein